MAGSVAPSELDGDRRKIEVSVAVLKRKRLEKEKGCAIVWLMQKMVTNDKFCSQNVNSQVRLRSY